MYSHSRTYCKLVFPLNTTYNKAISVPAVIVNNWFLFINNEFMVLLTPFYINIMFYCQETRDIKTRLDKQKHSFTNRNTVLQTETQLYKQKHSFINRNTALQTETQLYKQKHIFTNRNTALQTET